MLIIHSIDDFFPGTFPEINKMSTENELIKLLDDRLKGALRWNPKNSLALIMMGNIFAWLKDDIKKSHDSKYPVGKAKGNAKKYTEL